MVTNRLLNLLCLKHFHQLKWQTPPATNSVSNLTKAKIIIGQLSFLGRRLFDWKETLLFNIYVALSALFSPTRLKEQKSHLDSINKFDTGLDSNSNVKCSGDLQCSPLVTWLLSSTSFSCQNSGEQEAQTAPSLINRNIWWQSLNSFFIWSVLL